MKESEKWVREREERLREGGKDEESCLPIVESLREMIRVIDEVE